MCIRTNMLPVYLSSFSSILETKIVDFSHIVVGPVYHMNADCRLYVQCTTWWTLHQIFQCTIQFWKCIYNITSHRHKIQNVHTYICKPLFLLCTLHRTPHTYHTVNIVWRRVHNHPCIKSEEQVHNRSHPYTSTHTTHTHKKPFNYSVLFQMQNTIYWHIWYFVFGVCSV